MPNESGGLTFDPLSEGLIEAISLSIKVRACELDECVARVLSQISDDLKIDAFNNIKVVDEIYQELIYFSHFLSEISAAHLRGESCNVVSLLETCNVEAVKNRMMLLMQSSVSAYLVRSE